jgi:hypothetical protein
MVRRSAISKRWTAAGAIFVFAAIGVAYVLYVNVFTETTFVPMHFDSKQWKSSPSEFSHSSVRLRMADDFLAHHFPFGKTRSAVVEILGEPDDTAYFKAYDMVYHLGQERGWLAIDSEWIVLQLNDEGIVTTARLVTD